MRKLLHVVPEINFRKQKKGQRKICVKGKNPQFQHRNEQNW